jgi:23S rRNA pseudouridine2605 synthase
MDSEGLLLLTNDGDFTNRIMHPSHEVNKSYYTWVEGDCTDERLERLRQPMELDGVPLRRAAVELLERSENGAQLAITIHEGKNRQVRRMCELVGLRVTRLRRVSEGGVTLGNLKPGAWRALTEEEIRTLRG